MPASGGGARAAASRVRTRARLYVLYIDDIDWLEAAANYVNVHAKDETPIIRQTLQRLEESLSPPLVFRTALGAKEMAGGRERQRSTSHRNRRRTWSCRSALSKT